MATGDDQRGGTWRCAGSEEGVLRDAYRTFDEFERDAFPRAHKERLRRKRKEAETPSEAGERLGRESARRLARRTIEVYTVVTGGGQKGSQLPEADPAEVAERLERLEAEGGE
jgi:hypothetical protein